jgi:hypothetical protein|tara:strand:- start:4068 stop:4949 length:882 start_codon:yes stop_codon:yes gene_type:complete
MQPDYRESICPDKDSQRFDIAGFDQSLRLEELIDHIEFVKYLAGSTTPEDLSKRLLKIFKQFGFSDFALMSFPDNQNPHVFLTSLPKELLICYQGQSHLSQNKSPLSQDQSPLSQDMILDYLKADNPTHFHHSDIQQIIENVCFLSQSFDKTREILALYKKFEFNDAYLMPYKGDKKLTDNKDSLLFSLMTKGATQKEFIALTKSQGAVLHLLGDTAIRVYQNRFNDHNPLPLIAPKPLRLLNAMSNAAPKPNRAADKLCISIDTSNSHMALAKKILGELKAIQFIGQSSRAG